MGKGPFAPLCVAIVVAGALAGCLGGDGRAPVVLEIPAPYSLAGLALGALPLLNVSQATRSDWFVLAVNATPEGGLAGFHWTVPANGTVAGATEGSSTLALEVAPVVLEEGATLPDAWGLFVFVDAEDDVDGLVSIASVLEATYEGQERTGAAKQAASAAPTGQPFYLDLGDRVPPGGVLSIVLAAERPEAAEFAVAFRVLDAAPEPNADASKDFLAFRLPFASRAPLELQPVGNGTGFHAAIYSDANRNFAAGSEMWTKDVAVQESSPVDLRAPATTRDTRLVSDTGFTTGWSSFQVFYSASVAAAGRWSARGQLHGTELQHEGFVVQSPYGGSAAIALLGRPFLVVVADGPGEARVEFTLAATNPNHLQSFLFQHVAFGAPLAALVGADGAERVLAVPGTLRSLPPLADHDDEGAPPAKP